MRMNFSFAFKALFTALCTGTLALSTWTTSASASSANFDGWVESQAVTSKERMYRNISPAGAVPGTILASPSKENPNYYYYWVRDGALVMQSILGLYEEQKSLESLTTLMQFVTYSRDNQAKAAHNLGEPRFNVDGTVNTEPWGRPQNDGPALRALVLTRFAQNLLAKGDRAYVERELYSAKIPADTVIKTDLEYVAHHWREKCIDLWEEIWGQHFFTRAVQLAALKEGAKLANRMNDPGAANFYLVQAKALESELMKHWSESRGHYLATLDSDAGPDHQKPTELDTSVILAALAVEQSTGPLSITDGRILATAEKLEQTFSVLYGVNRDTSVGTAIGRYSEDYYFGGNPWVLTTAAFAELHYKLAARLQTARTFVLDREQARFFSRLKDGVSIRAGVDLADANNESLREFIIASLKEKADGFMKRIRLHVNEDGSFSEQYHRDTGFMISAYDLTWSYASFLRASSAKREFDQLRR